LFGVFVGCGEAVVIVKMLVLEVKKIGEDGGGGYVYYV